MSKSIFSFLVFFTTYSLFSQVKVGENPNTINPSAGLEIEYTNKGFLPPRMTTIQRDAIQNPVLGLQIYNTTTNCMEYYRPTGWYSMCPRLATLTTVTASSITGVSASSGGQITDDGGATITSRGVCWSMNPNPTLSNSFTSDGIGSGTFNSVINSLQNGTTYYVRAYATTSVGTAYGNEIVFTTLNTPTLSTSSVTLVYGKSTTSGGNVTSDGGAAVASRGLCWSTTQNPTIANSVISSGTGIGSFSLIMSGLNYSTIYYVRAFATNSVGTAYGNQVSFTTTAGTVVSFTTVASSSWTVPAGVNSAELLVVAGGGGGGGRSGGGGGGGGVVYHSNFQMSGSINVTVGGGGTFTETAPNNQSSGSNGGNSVFGSITALGGGGGGSYTAQAPINGGSGGGGSGGGNFQTGASGYQMNSGGGTGYGYSGGNGHPVANPYYSGGGGGAGGSGGNASPASGGNGGPGILSSITGLPVYYGGGGAGGSEPGGTLATGGLGGGGNGSNTAGGNGGNAVPNTGGGGGGTRSFNTTEKGGNGGSGLIIIKY